MLAILGIFGFLILIFIFGTIRGGTKDGGNQVLKVVRWAFILAALLVAFLIVGTITSGLSR